MAPARPLASSGAGPSSSSATGSRAVSGAGTRARRASGIVRDDKKGLVMGEQMEIEDFGPPAWRSVLNGRADLGFPDFYPSRPGFHQPEDVLTEENVKNGFVAKAYVSTAAEHFSMHGPIHNYLLSGGMDLIMRMGQEIIQKRDESMPQITDRIFRIPPRVYYNETQRVQFFADLANPAVPLHKLARDGKAPRDFKGVDLLDAMYARLPPKTAVSAAGGAAVQPIVDPIPADRALWFIRVLGTYEIAGHRQRLQAAPTPTAAPSPMPATPSSLNASSNAPVTAATLASNDWYTQETTGLFTAWLRAQLGQMLLPPKNPASKAAAGVLGDDSGRGRWLAKWSYSISLLREAHTRRLVSTRTLMAWFVEYLPTANLAQLGFVAQLIGDYLPDMLEHRISARHCVRGACEKIKEIDLSPAKDSLVKIRSMLEHLVASLVKADAEILLNPSTWRLQSDLLRGMTQPHITAEMERRNAALLHVPATNALSSPRRNQIEEISKLDSISAETNMVELCKSFFDGSSSPTSTVLDLGKFEEKAFILLNWAMGLNTLGVHRPYACHTMLRLWVEQRVEHLNAPFEIFPQLYNWLDTSPAARKERNIQAIGITFGEFTRQGMFSYSRYVHTLIARGHTARSRPNGPKSHHMDLLRSMPIFVVAKDLLQQRRIALSGDDPEARERDDTEEEAAMEAFREDCKEFVPELYGHKRYRRSSTLRDSVDHEMPSTTDITRFIFLQARFELAAESQKRLKRQGKIPAMNPSTFARVIHILHLCKGYSSIADFVIRALRVNDNQEILRISIDFLRCHADVWTAMDRWPVIVDALIDRFHQLDGKDIYHPRLPRLIMDLAKQGRAKEEDAEEMRSYIEYHEKAWFESMAKPNDAGPSMLKLRKVFLSRSVDTAQLFAQDLYDRHGPYDSWCKVWWTTIVDTLRGMTIVAPETAGVLQAITAHIDQVCGFAAFTIDQVVGAWLDSLGHNKYELFSAVSPFRQLVLVLVTRRRLSTMTILHGLIYPTWKHLSSLLLSSRPGLSPIQQQAIDTTVILVQQLLLTRPPNVAIPPLNTEEALIAQTSRSQVFSNQNIPDLIRHLPCLVVLGMMGSPEKTREQIALFFRDFNTIPAFKTAAFRHLGLLKDAFLSGKWAKAEPEVEAGMIETLKAIMSEGPSGRSSMPSMSTGGRLSAWRWTSAVLEMRVEFKRLAMRIDEVGARDTLRKLVGQSINRDHSPDDADLLCETFRGIDQAVVPEIYAAGLDRISALLSRMSEQDDQDQVGSDQAIDLVLRVICSAGSETALDTAVLSARQRLLHTIATLLLDLHSNEAGRGAPANTALTLNPGCSLRAAMKALRFVLGLVVTEAAPMPASQPEFIRLAVALLRVLTRLFGDDIVEMQDMLVYVMSAVAPVDKPALHLALLAECSTSSLQAALPRMPNLISVLPRFSLARRYMTLTNDADGVQSSYSLDDRPWELFEYMHPLLTARNHGEQFLALKAYQDTASIPASFFDPLIKRDALPGAGTGQADAADGELRWESLASERNLGNGFAGEPIAARQAATLLFAGPPKDLDGHHDGLLHPAFPPSSPATSASALSYGPARRMSTRIASAAAVSRGQLGTNRDPISIDDDDDDDDGAGSGSGDSSDDSDDLEDDKPLAKRPRTGSKTVGTGPPAGKRPTTGGKAPAKAPPTARKTVGGKNVGGKNVPRKTSGKAVSKRR